MSANENEMYENAKKSIENDSTLSEIQKKTLIRELDKKINNTRKLDIKIEADSGVLRELATENAELRKRAENQNSSTDSELAQSVRDSVIQKYADCGLECPSLETKEDLTRAVEIIKKIQNLAIEKVRESPSGSASLEGQYASMKGSGFQEGFETHSEMVDALRFQEKFGETDELKAQAKMILEQLYRKWITAKRENPNLIDKIPHAETPNEHLKRTRKKRER